MEEYQLDKGIIDTCWLSINEAELLSNEMRSPLVLQNLRDFIKEITILFLLSQLNIGIVFLMSEKKHVIVGMSGGVDSSVSAYLLIKSGYHVEGLFMKNWEEDDGTEYCTAKDDLADATSVCNDLKIKLHVANFSAEYWDNVFEHFLTEYQSGRTPNPDILCNKEIKFKAFLEYALDLGADFIATDIT